LPSAWTVSAFDSVKVSPCGIIMPTISCDGTQERTQVLRPIWRRMIWLRGPRRGRTAIGGSRFSCVPQPSSAGAIASSHRPSTLQVLTNSSGGVGRVARWVSRSLQWMTLTRSSGESPALHETLQPSAPAAARAAAAQCTRGDVQQPLFHEMRDQAGVGAVIPHGGGRAAPSGHQFHRARVAAVERFVDCRLAVELIRRIPGLERSVRIEHIVLARPLEDAEEIDAPGQVDDQVACADLRTEQPAEVGRHDALAHPAYALLAPRPELRALGELDHRNSIAGYPQMLKEQRQQGLRHDAKTRDQDSSGVRLHRAGSIHRSKWRSATSTSRSAHRSLPARAQLADLPFDSGVLSLAEHMAERPSLYLTQDDLERLSDLLQAQGGWFAKLEGELARAVVVPRGEIPRDVVTMNSRVVFENETTGDRREVTLVYPREADIDAGKISILVPVGTALLGLRVGQSIDWELPSGDKHRYRVIDVPYQPESAVG